MSEQNPIKTSRPVFDDPIDQNRYCAEEYGAVASLNGADPEREKNWRRWCWYLASLDGFPESHTKHSGEVVADRSVVSSPRDAWTSFCQRASIHDLADAMLNRYVAARQVGPQHYRRDSAA